MTLSRIITIALLCCYPFTASVADDFAEDRFVLLVDETGPGVDKLLSQRPSDAIESAETSGLSLDSHEAQTVLCAALIARRDLDDAIGACDTAVELAKSPVTTGMNPYGQRNRDALAIAYSNRAVLHSLIGDIDAATTDIKRALRQNRHVDAVTHNRTLVEKEYLANSSEIDARKLAAQ